MTCGDMMQLTNTQSGYGWIAILFHWSMAGLMLFMMGLGLYMTRESLTLIEKYPLYQLHKSYGFVVLAIVMLRLIWRLSNKVPALPPATKAWEKLAAHAVHILLFFLMFALPLTGWLMVSSSPLNIPTMLFDTINIPHLPMKNLLGSAAETEQAMRFIHWALAMALLVALALHVGAALKHHFILKDTTLKRMLNAHYARDQHENA